MSKKDVILVFTKEGIYNSVMGAMVPLPLLLVSGPLVEKGYNVRIIDQRIDEDWEATLKKELKNDPLCVGVSTMTGLQITNCLEISKVVRQASPNTKIVWGGVHPTTFPEQTLKHPLVDIVVSGNGEFSFLEVVQALEKNESLKNVNGVSYITDGGLIKHNNARPAVDLNVLPETPWHLVNIKNYLQRSFHQDDVLNVETSRGCPFPCTFCYCTTFHNRGWKALTPERTVELFKDLNSKYGIKSFQPVDDNFFVDVKRAKSVMTGILDEGLDIKMGFQGVRVDSIARMSHADLALLEKAGTMLLQFGVESGSDRVLTLIKKGLTRKVAIDTNKKLAYHKQLLPFYNFMCGFPTETKEDLFQSTSLAWNIIKNNDNALVSPFHIYKPYPGTEMYDLALQAGFKQPETLEQWASMDWTGETAFEFPEDLSKTFKAVSIVSIGVDRKIEAQSSSKYLRALAKIYRPYARFRFKTNMYGFMPEKFMLKA